MKKAKHEHLVPTQVGVCVTTNLVPNKLAFFVSQQKSLPKTVSTLVAAITRMASKVRATGLGIMVVCILKGGQSRIPSPPPAEGCICRYKCCEV
jgi:hypothetical protein